MLRRDQQIRTQIHQFADACIFSLSFLAAYALRANPQVIDWFNLTAAPPAASQDFVKLFFVLFPGPSIIFEWQGFYKRPPLAPSSVAFWPLLRGCGLATVGLIFVA